MLQTFVPDPPRYDLIPRGTVPRRSAIPAVPYRSQILKRRSPRYRTAADFDRRGTLLWRISIPAVPYRGGFRSPWYRTTVDFDRHRTISRRILIAGGTVPRRLVIPAVRYHGGLLQIRISPRNQKINNKKNPQIPDPNRERLRRKKRGKKSHATVPLRRVGRSIDRSVLYSLPCKLDSTSITWFL